MAETTELYLSKFSGGLSPDSKTGLVGATKFAKNLDIYSDKDSLSLNPKAVKVSGSTVTGLIKAAIDVSPYATDRYFYDENGDIYKETSGGTWTLDRDGAIIGDSAAGQGLAVLNDNLYYPTSTSLGKKGYLSNSPNYTDDFLSDNIKDLDQALNTSGQTYTLTLAVNEGATHLQTFIPTKDPQKSFEVNIDTPGTGDYTLTIHDADNVSIATVTITNGSLSAGDQKFTFSTPWRPIIGNTYHAHLHSTVADGKVVTTTASDFETADFHTYFGILLTSSYHPAVQFTNGVTGTIVIGNVDWIAEYDGDTYDPNRIRIEPGFEIRSITKENEYTVFAAWRGDSVSKTEEGRLYYWGGISPYYDFVKPVTGGLPNAVINHKNNLFSIIGRRGEINIGTEPFDQIQEPPKLARGKVIEVSPEALTVWQNRVQIGYGINTDDSNFEQAVYEYGKKHPDEPEVLNLGYVISEGVTKGTSIAIGLTKAFGKELYIGWKNSSTFGVDTVQTTNDPAASGTWESLIFDAGKPQKEKFLVKIVVEFESLPTGCTATPKYQLDRSGSFTTGTAATVSATRAEFLIMKRFKELEFGFDLTATVNYPNIKGVMLALDLLETERGDN